MHVDKKSGPCRPQALVVKLLQHNSALRLLNLNIEDFDVFKWLVIPISLCLLYCDDNIISLSDLHHSMYLA